MKWKIELEIDDTGDLYDKPDQIEGELRDMLLDYYEILEISVEPILED